MIEIIKVKGRIVRKVIIVRRIVEIVKNKRDKEKNRENRDRIKRK